MKDKNVWWEKIQNKEELYLELKMTKDWMLALLITIITILLIWLNYKNLIFDVNLFKIICLWIILLIMIAIFWKKFVYFKHQLKCFLFDITIVWFLSFFISWSFISSYRLYSSKCICKHSFFWELWNLKCFCDNSDLLLYFFIFFVLVYWLRFFILILLLPESKYEWR